MRGMGEAGYSKRCAWKSVRGECIGDNPRRFRDCEQRTIYIYMSLSLFLSFFLSPWVPFLLVVFVLRPRRSVLRGAYRLRISLYSHDNGTEEALRAQVDAPIIHGSTFRDNLASECACIFYIRALRNVHLARERSESFNINNNPGGREIVILYGWNNDEILNEELPTNYYTLRRLIRRDNIARTTSSSTLRSLKLVSDRSVVFVISEKPDKITSRIVIAPRNATVPNCAKYAGICMYNIRWMLFRDLTCQGAICKNNKAQL